MITVKTDKKRRVALPGAQIHSVFVVSRPDERSYLLTVLDEPEVVDLVPAMFVGLKPLTRQEAAACFAPNADFDELEAAMARNRHIPQEQAA